MHFLSSWRALISDPRILQAVSGYKLPFIHSTPLQTVEPSVRLSRAKQLICQREIANLCAKGAIEPVLDCKGQFLSSFFVIRKSSGGWRFILNLKNLNKFIFAPHFKLEDWKTVIRLLSPGDFLASLDLQDAYFLIPVCPEDRKFLHFRFQGQLFQFRILPFGLASAPYIFTKIMKPVVSSLRERGFFSVVYLDDFLLMAPSYEGCLRNIAETARLLSSLGFIINKDKSMFSPSQLCRFLGFLIDSVNFSVSIPPDKRSKLLEMTSSFLNMSSCKIRVFASYIGSLISVCPAVQYGILHT